MLITLTACGQKAPEAEKEEYSSETQVTESITESVAEKESEDISQMQEPEMVEATQEVDEQSVVVEKPQILSLQETRKARYEGINDFEKFLMINKFNYVTFWEGAETYPDMARDRKSVV